MTVKGRIYRRSDGKWEARIKAGNNRIVGTSGSQGYNRRIAALRPLRRLLRSGPHIVVDLDGNVVEPTAEQAANYKRGVLARFRRPYTGTIWQRSDGRWEWRITAGKNIVFVSHSQGYERPERAFDTLLLLCHGGPHEIVE